MTAPLPTRRLGVEGPAVSVIGYGGMHLSIVDRPDTAQALRVLHAAFDRGVTLIDTADAYCLHDQDTGHNERLIAEALRTWRGDRSAIVVATKGGFTRPEGRWTRNGRPKHLRQACERSLKALGVETIDLYQFHAPDADVPFAESVGTFADLRAEGKVRWVGLSNVSVGEIEEARALVPVMSVQNRLNPFFREALDDGVVAHCEAEEIAFLAYSPVGGGRLNRKLPSHPVLRDLSARLGASPHALVLAWVRDQGGTVIPIPSARTVEHLRDAVDAAGVTLDADARAAITAAPFSRA